MGDNLKNTTIKALTWSSIDRVCQQSLQLIIGLVFARLLSPSDFGLYGMVMIFTSLSFILIESGFSQALIRKKDATEVDFNTVFIFNVIIAFTAYVILFFTLPYISSFFHQPKLILIGRILFFTIIFNATSLVATVKVARVMDFKTLAKANVIGVFLSGVIGLMLAYFNFEVWALVIQQISFQLTRSLILNISVRWRPSFRFSFIVIREYWKFSFSLLGASTLTVAFNYLYSFILGRFYHITQLGYYTQANKLSDTFSYSIQSVLVSTTYSLFATIQDDHFRFNRIFSELSKKISLVAFPLFAALIVASKPLIFVVLSEKWVASTELFQLLCMSALFAPFYALNINALNSKGLSSKTFKFDLIKKLLILISVFFTYKLGIVYMLYGFFFSNMFGYFISMIYVKKAMNLNLKNQIKNFSYGLFISIPISVFIFLLSLLITNPYYLLSLQVAGSIIIYYLFLKLLFKSISIEIRHFLANRISELKKR